jgi:hypothetical protein
VHLSNELKNKLVESGMTFKVASSDVAWWHRIGESGKPTRSWAACFFDPAKQSKVFGHGHGAGRRARKLQHSGGEVELEQDWLQEGRPSKGKQGAAKGYTTARAGTSNTRAAAQDAASSIQVGSSCGHSVPAAAQAALLHTLTAASSLSWWRRTRAASVKRCAVNKAENTCSLSIRPSRHMMEAF